MNLAAYSPSQLFSKSYYEYVNEWFKNYKNLLFKLEENTKSKMHQKWMKEYVNLNKTYCYVYCATINYNPMFIKSCTDGIFFNGRL